MLRAEICEIGIVKLNVQELEYLLYLFEIAILIHSYMLQCVVSDVMDSISDTNLK